MATTHDWQREPGHPSESAVYRCVRCRLAVGASVVIVDGAPAAKLYAAPGGMFNGPEYVPCGGDDCCGPDTDD